MPMTDEELYRYIDQLNDLKKCESMARNIKTQRGESELFHHANYKASLLRKEEAQRMGRRPDIDYHVIGLKNGDEIYLPDTEVTATIFSHRTLEYKGREVYITPLERELIEELGLPRNKVVNKWIAQKNGRNLGMMYNEIYPKI